MQDADLKPLRRWMRRPLFSPSQMLTAQQLNLLVDDQRAHVEMLMRALHGHGVIFGFDVTLFEPCQRGDAAGNAEPSVDEKEEGANAAEISAREQKAGADKRESLEPAKKDEGKPGHPPPGSTELDIKCGMALDRHGRLLHWPGGRLRFCDIANVKQRQGQFTLMVHHARRRVPEDGCGPCGGQPEWVEDGVVFTLGAECADIDRACPKPERGKCVGWDEYICARTGSRRGNVGAAGDLKWACRTPGDLTPIDCSETYFDAKAGIPIACVTVADLAPAKCPDEWGFAEVGGACDVRPYVHRTPLLYELIRGCQDNLARVKSLSWQRWLIDDSLLSWDEGMDWEVFQKIFQDPDGLTIEFTRPLRVKSVHPGSVFLTVCYWPREGNFLEELVIPSKIEPISKGRISSTFKLFPDSDWQSGEFDQHRTLDDGATIRLTIRGQMVRDECGNMLNAVPLFYNPATPPQACPGGEFVAVFRVNPYDDSKPVQEKPKEPARRRRP